MHKDRLGKLINKQPIFNASHGISRVRRDRETAYKACMPPYVCTGIRACAYATACMEHVDIHDASEAIFCSIYAFCWPIPTGKRSKTW